MCMLLWLWPRDRIEDTFSEAASDMCEADTATIYEPNRLIRNLTFNFVIILLPPVTKQDQVFIQYWPGNTVAQYMCY